MAREIPLSDGHVAIIDDEDFPLFGCLRWYASFTSRGRCYVFRRTKDARTIYLHREILKAPAGLEVDHIDGNPLNNRRANLRLCTHRDNCRNSKKAWSKRGFKGTRQCPCGSWQAYIWRDGRYCHLGTFGSEVKAALAYDRAAREIYGTFACVNFPQPGERSALFGAPALPAAVGQ